jgi:hypothetical protein
MSEMLDRVAKSLFALTFVSSKSPKMLDVLWNELPEKTEWVGMSPREVVGKDKFRQQGLAAIQAMREPTDRMIAVGAEQVVAITDRKRSFHPVMELWVDVIDEALK